MNQNDLLLFFLFRNLFNQDTKSDSSSLFGQTFSTPFATDDKEALNHLQTEVKGIQDKFKAYSRLWEQLEKQEGSLFTQQDEFARLQERVSQLENEIKHLNLYSRNGQEHKPLNIQHYEGRIEGVESQVSALSLLIESAQEHILRNGQVHQVQEFSMETSELEFIREKMHALENQLNSMNQVFDWTSEQIKNNGLSNLAHEEKNAREFRETQARINRIEAHVEALDKIFGQLHAHFTQAFQEIEKQKDYLSPEVSHLSDKILKLEDKMKLYGEYFDKITQRLYEINKNAEPTEIPVNPASPAVKNDLVFPSDLNYVRHLHKMLFKTESELQAIFPDSFVIYQSKGDFPTSFFWMGEKMGLTYILIFRCAVGHSTYSFLPLISNILTNTLVLEGKYMDTGSIMKTMNEELYHLFQQNTDHEDKVHAGISVIDQTNARLYFMGANTDMLVNNSEFKLLEGDAFSLGQQPTENQEFTRYDIDWSKNIKFYLIPSVSQGRHKGLIARTNQLRYQGFEKQKLELTQYINSTIEEEFIMLGFSPD